MEWGEYVVLLVSYRGESGSKGRERGKRKGSTRTANQIRKFSRKKKRIERKKSDRFQTLTKVGRIVRGSSI